MWGILWALIWPWSVFVGLFYFAWWQEIIASSKTKRLIELEKKLEETTSEFELLKHSSRRCEQVQRKEITELRKEVIDLKRERHQANEESLQKIEAAKRVSIDSILGLRPEKKTKSRGA